jgi:hypothetical protein
VLDNILETVLQFLMAVKRSMRCRYASRSWRLARPTAGHKHNEFLLSMRSSALACWYC